MPWWRWRGMSVLRFDGQPYKVLHHKILNGTGFHWCPTFRASVLGLWWKPINQPRMVRKGGIIEKVGRQIRRPGHWVVGIVVWVHNEEVSQCGVKPLA